jgi:hypothetical protein
MKPQCAKCANCFRARASMRWPRTVPRIGVVPATGASTTCIRNSSCTGARSDRSRGRCARATVSAG